MSRSRVTASAVAALAVSTGAAAPATAALTTVDVKVSGISWAACPPAQEGQPSLDGFDCASLQVPLNYQRPSGRQIALGMVKHPATSGRAKGTIFFNPGGPGDQGTVFLPGLLTGFGHRIVRNFDLVSWDPRGMGGTTTPVVQCYDTAEEEAAVIGAAPFPALDQAQMKQWGKAHSKLNRACGDSDLALLRHVSTADNARDLDTIRKTMGIKKLSYYGTSYGTFLGATYASMYPTRYEHIVLDGAIDPLAWTQKQGDLSTFMRAGSDVASAQTLRSFLRICGKKSTNRCAFSAGSPGKTVKKYTKLVQLSKKGIATPEGTATANDVVGFTVASLYLVNPAPGFAKFEGWTALAQSLQDFWEVARASSAAATSSAVAQKVPYMGVERQAAVVCGDGPHPNSLSPYIKQASDSLKQNGVGAALWTWLGYCAHWPVHAASPYLGPWNTAKRPIVVVGTTGDPATPYSNAVSTSELLPNARLLTVKGYGHTALANPSTCAQRKLAAYFLSDRLPARAAQPCEQNVKPFAK